MSLCKTCQRPKEHLLSICLCEMSDGMLEVTLDCASVAAGLGVTKMVELVLDVKEEQKRRL